MLLSLKWLKEFVPYEGSPVELGNRLTMLGLELDAILRPFAAIESIVIGRVATCENHPDSDHLHVCVVDVGGEDFLTIVCGAPNVAAGQLVPVALVGSELPGGLKIKKAKLRGVESFGMICSEREMGLTDDHSGILVLPERDRFGRKIRPGQKFVEALDLDTEVLEIGITPNRADCLSVLGYAREVSAIFGLPLTMPVFTVQESGQDISGELSVEIADPDHCPGYTGRVLENVRVEPSPLWLRCRLQAVGIRPISNLVDVTNYVLMELGQPLHAFDRDKLEGGRIVIAPAKKGDALVTLDGVNRVLEDGDGLICDAVRPVALAGVMGGLATEITPETKSVFVECAVFNQAAVRRTSRRLGLSSESSYRYERGIDQAGMDFARERAIAMMAELSGGSVRAGLCRKEPKPWRAELVQFRPGQARDLLGVELEADFCAKTLESLGCAVDRKPEIWRVTQPSWRGDLTREVDLIEEIARFYGMDLILPTLPSIAQNLDRYGKAQSSFAFQFRLRHWAAGIGLNEAVNYSFVGNKDLDRLNLPREGRVSLMNPLTEDLDVLRTALAPGLLNNLRQNISHGAAGLRLFELAQAFFADPSTETSVREERRLGVLLYGARQDQAWPYPLDDMDYTDLKGIIEHFFAHFLRLPLPLFELLPADQSAYPYLSPAISIRLADKCAGFCPEAAGEPVGVLGLLRSEIADFYGARKDVWLADCDLERLAFAARQARTRLAPLPVFPPVRRDITVITPTAAGLRVGTVLEAIRAGNYPLLERADLLDIYEAEKKGERNLTFRLTFRHVERTLQDAEVDREREKVAEALVQTLPVRV